MRYYYLHPFKAQYFFPKEFRKYKLFNIFFQPYSLAGAVSWWLFRHFVPFRLLLTTNDIEKYIPEAQIRKELNTDAIMAFNKGTPGPEQKITALGIAKDDVFFLKFAQTPLACKNVTNEHNILAQLQQLNFVPAVIGFWNTPTTVLLKTNVLQGKRYASTIFSEQIIEILLNLSEQNIETTINFESDLKTCFGHGDFCPWNMMENNGKIMLFDWELAGTYPIGFDLFTFLFQTAFLLKPEKKIPDILAQNQFFIQKYFTKFNIDNWKIYLIEFSRIKVELESKKGEKGLIQQYEILLDYAQKA